MISECDPTVHFAQCFLEGFSNVGATSSLDAVKSPRVFSRDSRRLFDSPPRARDEGYHLAEFRVSLLWRDEIGLDEQTIGGHGSNDVFGLRAARFTAEEKPK